MEYILPVYPGENGKKPEGDAALGVNGVWSKDVETCLFNYIDRYNISIDTFVDHIENKVVYDFQQK